MTPKSHKLIALLTGITGLIPVYFVHADMATFLHLDQPLIVAAVMSGPAAIYISYGLITPDEDIKSDLFVTMAAAIVACSFPTALLDNKGFFTAWILWPMYFILCVPLAIANGKTMLRKDFQF